MGHGGDSGAPQRIAAGLTELVGAAPVATHTFTSTLVLAGQGVAFGWMSGEAYCLYHRR